MNADRRSAYNAMFSAASFQEALDFEFKHGAVSRTTEADIFCAGFPVVQAESVAGAKKFIERQRAQK